MHAAGHSEILGFSPIHGGALALRKPARLARYAGHGQQERCLSVTIQHGENARVRNRY